MIMIFQSYSEWYWNLFEIENQKNQNHHIG
ncbi:uncharacterized protein METZ01_LOCUS24763 [marine metagenome]|uniref:Uncharacterized protein n=1 Tax=marine metagenome TaxID=408172 RepID=A0A381Q0V8_9ZZZZ